MFINKFNTKITTKSSSWYGPGLLSKFQLHLLQNQYKYNHSPIMTTCTAWSFTSWNTYRLRSYVNRASRATGRKFFQFSSSSSSSHSKHAKAESESFFKRIYNEIKSRPIQYLTIPSIAGFVGISTNYMGVQMLFYPIDYIGTNGQYSYRFLDDHTWIHSSKQTTNNNQNQFVPTLKTHHHWNSSDNDSTCMYNKYTPYGIIGWQGVVPARTEKMALRLVDIVTKELLALKEVFARLNHVIFAQLIVDPVLEAVERDCGRYWALVLKPFMPFILQYVIKSLQRDIEDVLDLEKVVLNAFVRDKIVLVELFQNVGRVELDFLVKSGLGFGLLLGVGQMIVWAAKPKMWTLPVAGALVGYITNWIAIKLLFEPAEPIEFGPLILQGMFESRQVEVSEEFAYFMEKRVLSSPMLLDALTNQNENEMFDFLRKQLPWPIPEHVLRAAMEAIRTVALNPKQFEHIHSYISQSLDIEDTLSSRLKTLSPQDFEDLLHPVFKEDEIILIVVGGVLGAIAGLVQTRLGWGGSNAMLKAGLMLVGSSFASAFFYVLPNPNEVLTIMDSVTNNKNNGHSDKEGEHISDSVRRPSQIQRKNSLLRTKSLG